MNILSHGLVGLHPEEMQTLEKNFSIEKFNEYIFFKTLGDYVFCKLIKTNDNEYEGNMKLYSAYMRA